MYNLEPDFKNNRYLPISNFVHAFPANYQRNVYFMYPSGTWIRYPGYLLGARVGMGVWWVSERADLMTWDPCPLLPASGFHSPKNFQENCPATYAPSSSRLPYMFDTPHPQVKSSKCSEKLRWTRCVRYAHSPSNRETRLSANPSQSHGPPSGSPQRIAKNPRGWSSPTALHSRLQHEKMRAAEGSLEREPSMGPSPP